MRPILYANDETAFTSNGLGRLSDCTRCEVTEERNGIYICEFDIPVTSPMYSTIKEGCYIAAIHDDRHDIQPFEIYGRSAPINGVVTFFAHHLSYKLSNVIMKPFTASSCAQTFQKLQSETYNPNPFTFWTDKAVNNTFKNEVPASCRSLLAGQEGSILDVYGTGEYEFDKWAVKLYLHRGNDNGVSIRYGVNLTDIEHETDISNSFSAIAPYWKSDDGQTVVMLPEGYIVSPNVPIELFQWTTETGEFVTDQNGNIIEFATPNIVIAPYDMSSNFEEAPTVEQLRTAATNYLANNSPWLPKENITVSFVDMAHTEDYKDIAALQRVSLCDRVSVYCGPLGVDAVSMKVIRVVYNVLAETYNEIELGDAATTFAETVLANVEDLPKNIPTKTEMENAIEHATELITGGLGGYVIFNMNANGQPEEILIMDTPDTQTAVNVWRFNKNGLGHSHNGYNGPFNDVALTYDGKINASMITTGQLNASLVKAGTLSAVSNNNNFWNMETGMFVLRSAGASSGIVYYNGVLTISADNITTGTLSAYRIKGGILSLGGLNNSNGVLNILDANDNIIGSWTNTGVTINAGQMTTTGVRNGYTYKTVFGLGAIDFYVGDTLYSKLQMNYSNSRQTLALTSEGVTYVNGDEGVSIRGGESISTGFAVTACIKEKWTSYYLNSGAYQGEINISSDGIKLDAYVAYLDISKADRKTTVYGGFAVMGGTKSRIVETDQYSDRLLYCYETPSPMFGDVGEGVISEDGRCYVWLDPVFAQTITTTQYQVFLQKYGTGDCWIAERKPGYFVVEGTAGLAFGWELKAKQADFDQYRLERNTETYKPDTRDYGGEAAQHIDDLKKGRIAA